MALMEDMFKGGNVATGLALGIGAAVFVPMVRPVLRPATKTAVKAGLFAYDQGRAVFSQLTEQAGDLVSEIRQEMEEAESEEGKQRGRAAGTRGAKASAETKSTS